MPIESYIAPLVFSLTTLKIFVTYWSCEGHCSRDGLWIRIPQVWFHCRSLAHVRLLHDWLSQQWIQKKISVPWVVMLTHAGLTLDTGFCLQPELNFHPEATLPMLQHDALHLGQALAPGLVAQAGEMMAKHLHFPG
ncbi:MAG: hypothetical protein AABY83_05305 [Pseudomonadota bacterium]